MAKEYKYSAAVFIGEVVKVSKEGNVKRFEFDVERYWKGVSSKKIVLSVYENMRFQAQYKEGRRYLVFAKKSENNDILIDRRCSRSTEINEYLTTLETDLEKLGEAKTCIDLKEKEVDE